MRSVCSAVAEARGDFAMAGDSVANAVNVVARHGDGFARGGRSVAGQRGVVVGNEAAIFRR